MVPLSRNPMSTQMLQHSREPFMVLRQVLVSGPIAADGRLQFLGGAPQALAVDARRVRKDVSGP